ncbi:hypothetical protein BDN72DRAFT_134542 [Pluteus cervinus]|uniref:Uncharacterized protein n=1 Tax=Pluteus cervinus TaxID=181527 RepID=A0ACD3B7J5_9AGAR|nr:hypothetical protein BDN72DRAFT_134542 [Pluteus cervinus]
MPPPTSTTPLLSSSSSTPPSHLAIPQPHPLPLQIPLPPPLPNRSFIYPLYGIPYVLTHPSLHPILLTRIPPLLLVSITTITLLFIFLYIPHVATLALFGQPYPLHYASLMILSESAGIVSILAEAFLTEPQIIDVFDMTMLERTKKEGLRVGEDMIGRVRVLERKAGGADGEWVLGKYRVYPYLKFRESFKCSVLFLVELPLNLIPGFGTPLFFLLQAYHLGPLHHYHYFQLLGWDDITRKEYIHQNRWKYIAFGLVHVLLQLIPVLNIFFLFSTGAGAALWASKAEERRYEESRERERGRVGERGLNGP